MRGLADPVEAGRREAAASGETVCKAPDPVAGAGARTITLLRVMTPGPAPATLRGDTPPHRPLAPIPGIRPHRPRDAAAWPACLWVSLSLVLAAASGLARAADAPVDRAAAHRAQLCSPSNPTGVGLRGDYFAGEAGRGRVLLSRTDETVDFDASLEWPSGLAGRPRSVRWSGWVKAPFAGKYRLEAEPANAVVVVGAEVLQGPGVKGGGSIELEPGRFYPIEVRLDRLPAPTASTRIALRWTAPHGARYVIPRNLLFLPTETVKAARP